MSRLKFAVLVIGLMGLAGISPLLGQLFAYWIFGR